MPQSFDRVVADFLEARHTIDSPVVLGDAASIVLDAAKGDLFQVTLAGNRTMAAPLNAITGQPITIIVIQDATGGRTLAWNAIFLHAWSDTGNTAGKQCAVSFRFNGTNWVQLGQGPYV